MAFNKTFPTIEWNHPSNTIKFLDYDSYIDTKTIDYNHDLDKELIEKISIDIKKSLDEVFLKFIWAEPSTRYPFKKVSYEFLEVHPEYFDFLVKIVEHYNIDVSDVNLTYNYNPFLGSGVIDFREISGNLQLNFSSSQINNLADFKYIALHELRHIYQFKSNNLKCFSNNTCVYLGSPYKTIEFDLKDHVKLPHELDANKFTIESPFFDENVSHSIIKDIVTLTKEILK